MLGRLPEGEIPNDPFWLPGSVVDIDAEPKGDSFWVAVRTETPEQAQALVTRAKAFMAARGSH